MLRRSLLELHAAPQDHVFVDWAPAVRPAACWCRHATAAAAAVLARYSCRDDGSATERRKAFPPLLVGWCTFLRWHQHALCMWAPPRTRTKEDAKRSGVFTRWELVG